MSGENQRDDDSDFLDDDFILEDVAAKNEELDQLFEEPLAPVDSGTTAGAEADADDLLFTDHSREPVFEQKPQFVEGEAGTWDGEAINLEELEEAEAAAAARQSAGDLAAAEQSFTQELDSLLKGDEEFGLDSEQDLEVIGADPTAADDEIAEFEQSGPFVLDDGEGTWQEDTAAAVHGSATDADEDTGYEEVELGVPLQAATGEEEPVEPGWEPLPAASVDHLAEVGEVSRMGDGEAYAEEPVDAQELTAPGFGGQRRPALVGAGAGAEVEGHDLYPEDEEVAEVVGTTEVHRRGVRMFVSLAATLSILAAAAVMVMRPEWIGLKDAPDRTQQVEVSRPTVAVTVPVPEGIDGTLEPVQPDKPTVVVGPDPVPVTTDPPEQPTNPDPVTPPPPQPLPVIEEPVTTPTQPVEVATVPGEQAPVTPDAPGPEVVPVPPPVGSSTWPVREEPAVSQSNTGNGRTSLIRVNENLLIGEPDDATPRKSTATEGVLPGSRAFAQLTNGNYFIGSVKSVDSQRLTLTVDTGEVTLPVAALARLTELGSADYTELQRVTSGFVRLTNNNRLVGGILSGIADDHVILEFRSNRVMLPRSAVGQVVQGEGDAAVRLDTTREEDDWLRRLVERQVGAGAPPVPTPTPSPVPPDGGSSPR